MAHKHVKRWSILLAIREMKIKTTVKYYCVPIRAANTENSDTTKCWWGVKWYAVLRSGLAVSTRTHRVTQQWYFWIFSLEKFLHVSVYNSFVPDSQQREEHQTSFNEGMAKLWHCSATNKKQNVKQAGKIPPNSAEWKTPAPELRIVWSPLHNILEMTKLQR